MDGASELVTVISFDNGFLQKEKNITTYVDILLSETSKGREVRPKLARFKFLDAIRPELRSNLNPAFQRVIDKPHEEIHVGFLSTGDQDTTMACHSLTSKCDTDKVIFVWKATLMTAGHA